MSYSRFFADLPVVAKEEKQEKAAVKIKISQSVRDAVYEELRRLSGLKTIGDGMDLSRDLGLDSLDLGGLQAFLQERYAVKVKNPAALKTVYDVFVLILDRDVLEPTSDMQTSGAAAWPQEACRPQTRYPMGKTVPECFLETADRMGKAAACSDATAKILSYRRLKAALYILGKKFQELEGDYVAVMLPSSVGCYVLILAILMAGKIPVVLNWTAGERNLKFAVERLGLKKIFSARRFLERVEGVALGDLEEKIVLMEEFRRGISLGDKFFGFFLSRASRKKWKRRSLQD